MSMSTLDFSKAIILENERVLLRPIEQNDLDGLVKFAISEPSLWKYSLMSADGVDNMKNYLKSALDARKRQDSYPFLVYDKKLRKVAGSTRFYDYQRQHNTVQLGYTWFGKEFWGTGLNKNCKLLMLQFAFEELEINRVEFRADANNARSIAAMKSIGCQEEGILRSNCAAPDGSRRDSIVLSILKSEWNGSVKEKLLQSILLFNK